MKSKSSLDGFEGKETQPPLPPKADRYNQLKKQLTSGEGKKQGEKASHCLLSVTTNKNHFSFLPGGNSPICLCASPVSQLLAASLG